MSGDVVQTGHLTPEQLEKAREGILNALRNEDVPRDPFWPDEILLQMAIGLEGQRVEI
jgi:hypothetical protein